MSGVLWKSVTLVTMVTWCNNPFKQTLGLVTTRQGWSPDTDLRDAPSRAGVRLASGSEHLRADAFLVTTVTKRNSAAELWACSLWLFAVGHRGHRL